MEIVIIVSSAGCIIGLICAASVTSSVMKNIDKIGKHPDVKRETISRALFNFYAVLSLSFVILSKALNFIDSQLFIAFFVIILGGLGFKISHEVMSRPEKLIKERRNEDEESL